MNDSLLVRVLQRFRDFSREADSLRKRELNLAREVLAQRLTFDIGHNEEERPVDLSGVVQRQDVRMGEASCDRDLAQKTLGSQGVRDVRDATP